MSFMLIKLNYKPLNFQLMVRGTKRRMKRCGSGQRIHHFDNSNDYCTNDGNKIENTRRTI